MTSNYRRNLKQRLSEAQNHRCCYCGVRSNDLTFEHVVPKSKGGTNHWYNLVMACEPCNAAKLNFRAQYKGVRWHIRQALGYANS